MANVTSYTVLLRGGGRVVFTPSAFRDAFTEEQRVEMIGNGTVVIESIITEPGNFPVNENEGENDD